MTWRRFRWAGVTVLLALAAITYSWNRFNRAQSNFAELAAAFGFRISWSSGYLWPDGIHYLGTSSYAGDLSGWEMTDSNLVVRPVWKSFLTGTPRIASISITDGSVAIKEPSGKFALDPGRPEVPYTPPNPGGVLQGSTIDVPVLHLEAADQKLVLRGVSMTVDGVSGIRWNSRGSPLERIDLTGTLGAESLSVNERNFGTLTGEISLDEGELRLERASVQAGSMDLEVADARIRVGGGFRAWRLLLTVGGIDLSVAGPEGRELELGPLSGSLDVESRGASKSRGTGTIIFTDRGWDDLLLLLETVLTDWIEPEPGPHILKVVSKGTRIELPDQTVRLDERAELKLSGEFEIGGKMALSLRLRIPCDRLGMTATPQALRELRDKLQHCSIPFRLRGAWPNPRISLNRDRLSAAVADEIMDDIHQVLAAGQ